MLEREHAEFLVKLYKDIAFLIVDKARLAVFRHHLEEFKAAIDAYSKAHDQYLTNSLAQPTLRRKTKRPPTPGWEWHRYGVKGEGYWHPPEMELPPNLTQWLPPSDAFGILGLPDRSLTDQQKLLCDYALLAVIHDGQTAPTDTRISEGLWSDDDEWPQLLWEDWSSWDDNREHWQGERNRARLLTVFERVKADLQTDGSPFHGEPIPVPRVRLSTAVSKAELARRLLGKSDAREREAKAIMDSHDLHRLGNKWTIRLDPDLGADAIDRLSKPAP